MCLCPTGILAGLVGILDRGGNRRRGRGGCRGRAPAVGGWELEEGGVDRLVFGVERAKVGRLAFGFFGRVEGGGLVFGVERLERSGWEVWIYWVVVFWGPWSGFWQVLRGIPGPADGGSCAPAVSRRRVLRTADRRSYGEQTAHCRPQVLR
jgi:hypothetical protein